MEFFIVGLVGSMVLGVGVGIADAVKRETERDVAEVAFERVVQSVRRNPGAWFAWTTALWAGFFVELAGGNGGAWYLGVVCTVGVLRSWVRLGMMLHARRNRRTLIGSLWWYRVRGGGWLGYDEDNLISTKTSMVQPLGWNR